MGVQSCVAVVVMVVVVVVEAFNVLPEGVSDFSGPAGSQFGFSIALWKDSKGVKRVVVGAPKGNQTWAGATYPLGVAYLCSPPLGADDDDDGGGGGGGGSGGGECQVQPNLTLDNDEVIKKNLTRTYNFTLTNYGMALGQTIVAEKGEGTKMTVCSPRFPKYNREDSVLNNGMCFFMEEPNSVSPLSFPFNSAFENSLGGYSAASKEGNLVVGAPTGSFACGAVMNCKRGRCPYRSKDFTENKKILNSRKKCSSTYEGWAVEAARFGGALSELTIAASSPKANNYKGQISFYDIEVRPEDKPLSIIKGEEMGALFGYALACPDVDGDGAADLVIGAPLATNTPQKLYDAGQVVIHYAPLKDEGRTRPPKSVLWGRDNRGHFGTSVASLGDINGDIYHDVAVGAPYGGEEGNGLVYIYNGGQHGLIHTNPKLISPSEFFPGARGFGFSLDGNLDMDGNGYPDMAVGAVHSSSAVLIRASPVVKLTGTVQFNPSPIDIKSSVCEIELPGQKKMRGVCFDVRVDFQYSSKGTYTSLVLEYDLKMTSHSNSTMKYGFKNKTDRKTREARQIYKDRKSAWSLSAFVQRSRDNLNLEMSVTVAVVRVVSYAPLGLPPILDILSPTSFNTSSRLVCLDINSDCSTEPDLVLNAFGDPVIMVEVPVRIHLNVSVEVRRDPAYGIKVNVKHPDHIEYTDVYARGIIPHCRKTQLGRSEIQCSIDEGNADEKIDFWLIFEHQKAEDEDKLLNGTRFSLSVENDVIQSDPDRTNNRVTLTIPTVTKATLYPQSASEPDVAVVAVNETATQTEIEAAKTTRGAFPVDRLGPRVDHIFSLNNRGPSPVQNVMLLFHVPLYLQDDPLTYFMMQPLTSPGITCNPLSIDPYSLQLPRPPVTDAPPFPHEEIETEAQLWRDKREVDEEDDTTTSRSTSTYTESSTFHWSTDPTEYFSTTYDSVQSRQLQNDSVLECTKPECLVTCIVERVPAGDSVKVTFSSYLVTATLDKLNQKIVLMRTSMTVNVTQEGIVAINPKLAATTAIHLNKPLKNWLLVLPLWLIILAVVLSVFFIAIIILGLWKGGFFKRKRPHTDRQSFVPEKDYRVDNEIPDTQ